MKNTQSLKHNQKNIQSPPYFTESTEVVLFGIKHNAKLLLLLRVHTELHLALGDSIL